MALMTSPKLLTTALILSVITVGYNLIEGIVSVLFGAETIRLRCLALELIALLK